MSHNHNNCHQFNNHFIALKSYTSREAASRAVAETNSTSIGQVCNEPEGGHLYHDDYDDGDNDGDDDDGDDEEADDDDEVGCRAADELQKRLPRDLVTVIILSLRNCP